VEGTLRASELARDRVEDARTVLSVGQEIEAKYIGMDRKTRTIALSIKAKDSDEEAAAIADYSKGSTGGSAKLGDVLKEQLENSGD
jgi:small subunit ribosomal protein S1